MKKLFMAVLIIVCFLGLSIAAFAADQKKAANAATVSTPSGRQQAGQRPLMRPNFTMIFGSITRIDNSNPAKPMLEVKSDADGKIHLIETTPSTSITKFTEISELKVGEPVRVMTRNVDKKEVAMGVMFGKIRNLPAPKTIPTKEPAKNQ